MITLTLALLLAQQGSLERRIAGAPDGSVRFSFAARPGVYGNGRNIISWDCKDGASACDSGPVRIALTRRGGAVTEVRAYVGGEWRTGASGTDPAESDLLAGAVGRPPRPRAV
ncbi:MAG: hypothetical protein Q8Q14_06065 [Gemmatimonadales bacterium]|nr:hypothetical protein [Gemmatimonadales bacterium]